MQFLTVCCTVNDTEITACFVGSEGKDALCRQGLQSLYHLIPQNSKRFSDSEESTNPAVRVTERKL